MFGTFSAKLAHLPGLAALLGQSVVHLRSARDIERKAIQAIVGWGQRPSTTRPRALATRLGLPFIALEDGFLRSWGTGATHPSLSLVVDTEGIYYDARQPSALERLLASDTDILVGPGSDYDRARAAIAQARLSKYNFAPDVHALPHADAKRPRILIVDQTCGDASIQYGMASEASFAAMLAAARCENPEAIFYVKTHPEVSSHSKRGHYDALQADDRTVLLREAVNPSSLLAHMDRVYVVTSQLGFEALLAGVPVSCFGMPWYAGWGVSDDRISCPRRQRSRSVDELFAAAYLHYTRYLNPLTHERGSIFDVIDWLVHQRYRAAQLQGRSIAVGYRNWKAADARPFLALAPQQAHFVADVYQAARLHPAQADRLIVWGAEPVPEIAFLAQRSSAKLLRMEDGFIRSVGLGSDFVPPLSLVLDQSGMYFDPRQPSDLETLLNTFPFSEHDLARAAHVRALIRKYGITKYNVQTRAEPAWRSLAHAQQRRIILVPGQVEDDASIRYGCEAIRSNLALLRAARSACPQAFIVYKPHPDVMAGNRTGQLAHAVAMQYADAIETEVSALDCIAACDEVHTMTSLLGFDALLRDKKVVVYGRPFYAGWGLTEDRLSPPRRRRCLTLDELIAGSLLHYPLYWDWTLNGFTTCEAAIMRIVRDLKAGLGNTAQLSYSQRQWRKLKQWARAGFLVAR